jgi:hypothetical protein
VYPESDGDRRVQVSAEWYARGHTGEDGKTPPEGDHQENRH